MRTLIVSDLHLGSVSRTDLLRRPELRAPLLEAAAGVDRVVLLGDVLELRHGPPRVAMAAARGFFEDLGRSLGGGGEVVVVPGNHDHTLIEPWLARRAQEDEPRPLEVEAYVDVQEASVMLARMAAWTSPARLIAAYPGLWIRPDVYATHGHYLDCHLTVPTLERLSMGLMSRVLRKPAGAFSGVEDYEAVESPVFAWRDAVARNGLTGDLLNGMVTANTWRALGAGGGAQTVSERPSPSVRRLRRRALVAAFPLAVAALNRAGLGPLRADVSSGELRRAGLRAMGQVAARIGVEDGYVIFGHTHRAGPLPGDREQEWRGRDGEGARLLNCGSWTYAPVFLTPTPGESPYWPGTYVLFGDSGPPEVRGLLSERAHAELMPARA
jgi:UDP-2,3-diacylglucosamine pyrophosphatase LpxH